ncbi:uncharacterized protein [Haliotis asinina]|uniref:uncharacterized protein n=1 Tax=Haliotis asinina TaxID=109174 RepID=UPI0035320DC9
MLHSESLTSRHSLPDIFVKWVTLGLDLILLVACRGIGVCQSMLAWLVQHDTLHGSGYGMIINDDGPLGVDSRIESLWSFLNGSPSKMHNVFSMSEGKWNTADYYQITENNHEIVTEQPISETKWIHCRAEVDACKSYTGYESITSFSDSIRKDHIIPPGDGCTLMPPCEDEPPLPERDMQWFLLNCIAIMTIYELQMTYFRIIQDPEIKTDAQGSSFTNVVNCETDFTSKETCVSSSGAGFELKKQSDVKSRNQGETWLSDSCTNMTKDTDTSNVPRKPRNSDTHRQEGENGYHSSTVTPRLGDTLRFFSNDNFEIITIVSGKDFNVNTDGKQEGSANRADGMGERISDKREGSTRHGGGKKGGSDNQIFGRSGFSDSQDVLAQNDIEVEIDGKPGCSDMQDDGKSKPSDMNDYDKPERSDMQVDAKPDGSDMQVDGNPKSPNMQVYDEPKRLDMQVDMQGGSDMQAGGKQGGSDMQVDGEAKPSNMQVDGNQEGSDMKVDGNPERLDMQIDGKPEHSEKQADCKSERSEMQADGKHGGSDMQVGGKQGGSDMQVDGEPKPSDMQVNGNPERLDMQVDGKPELLGMQVDDKLEGSDMHADGKAERSDIQAGAIPETYVFTLTKAGQIHNMESCVKTLKGQMKRIHCCLKDRILSGPLWRYKPKLLTSIYRYRDRKKRLFVNQKRRPRSQKFLRPRNIPDSISEEIGTFQFLSTTESLPRSSHTSQNFETNRQTEEAFFRGKGHQTCAGNPEACSDFVDGLIYKAGDSWTTIKRKEELKFLLRPDQQLCERQTVKGLAMHCLPKMELWEIQRLMESERRGYRHETCVDHVFQELKAHGLKVGHVVQYFSQHHSRRHDVIRVIEKIHGDCKFCSCLYDHDDYDSTSGI